MRSKITSGMDFLYSQPDSASVFDRKTLLAYGKDRNYPRANAMALWFCRGVLMFRQGSYLKAMMFSTTKA